MVPQQIYRNFYNTIDGTISVTDETYSWNDIDGNPGEQATAYIIIINGFVIYADIENGGSGYDDENPPLVTITGDGSGASATATVENGVITGIDIAGTGMDYTEGDIIIAPPPAPFTVDKVDGNLEVGYASSPSNGTGVVATYKTLEPSIIGALSEASSHLLELTVDGTAQNPIERILSVPFAQVAGKISDKFNSSSSSHDYLQFYFDDSGLSPMTCNSDELTLEKNQKIRIINEINSGENSNKIKRRIPPHTWGSEYCKVYIEQGQITSVVNLYEILIRFNEIVGPAKIKIFYKWNSNTPESFILKSDFHYQWHQDSDNIGFFGHLSYELISSSHKFAVLF